MNEYILSIDPSGSFIEGKGTTGWSLLSVDADKIIKFGVIRAVDYDEVFDYYDAHVDLIDGLSAYKPDIVIEDYRLYADRAMAQTNSILETPRLIGILLYECFKRGIKVHTQTASQVKTRWADHVLVHKGYLTKENNTYYINGHRIYGEHIKDAVRHAVHFKTFERSRR